MPLYGPPGIPPAAGLVMAGGRWAPFSVADAGGGAPGYALRGAAVVLPWNGKKGSENRLTLIRFASMGEGGVGESMFLFYLYTEYILLCESNFRYAIAGLFLG